MYLYKSCEHPQSIDMKTDMCLRRSVHIVQQSNVILPHDCAFDIYDVSFGIDTNMTLDNGVMGYTRFGSDMILLAPTVVENLKWNYNNELGMSVVIHELTHRAQMKWLYGLVWPILNAPLIAQLTIERWACENGEVARLILADEYEALR